MLQIKAGVVIHIDYEITQLASDGTVKKTCRFINNEISDDQFHRYGLDTISDRLEYGISRSDSSLKTVVMPVVSHQLKNRVGKHTYHHDHSVMTLSSEVNFVSGAIATDGALVNIRELGIRDVSRLLLIDPQQGLDDGLVISDGDSLETKLTFMYSFYTNDRTMPLADTKFGDEVFYTSEVVELPNFSRYSLDNSNGFNHPTGLSVFPITENIIGVPTSKVTFPHENEFQENFFTIDNVACRADVLAHTYNPTEIAVFGFIFRLNLFGVGILVRLNKGVVLGARTRYEVAGYIGWSAFADDIDDGFNTNTLSDQLDKIGLSSALTKVAIARPIPNNDVAVQVNSLTSMEILVDNEAPIIVPSGASYHTTRLLALQHNIQVDLYSNRVDNKTPSTLDFIRPDPKAHLSLTDDLPEDTFAPLIIVGGNYNDVTDLTENSWRWDSYYPYMGPGYKYKGYIVGSIEKALRTIKAVGDIHPDTTLTTVGRYEYGSATPTIAQKFNPIELVEQTVSGAENNALFYQTYVWDKVVDPSITNNGFTYRIESDFDTAEYLDWVPGKTSIQMNFLFLNIVPEPVEVQQDNTTQLTITVDSTKHNPAHAELWVDQVKIGDLSSASFKSLSQYMIDVVETTVGNKTTYVLSKPFNSTASQTNQIYIFGNAKAVNDANEVAYVRINAGKAGFKVYNKSGSDISKELYLQENPFLAMGAVLSQPVPEYIFRNKIFTASEAARHFNRTIATSLNDQLFSIGFNDFVYNITYAGTLDSRDSNLNSNELYPAVGIDLSGVDPLVPPETIILVDNDNKSWTKQELLELKTAQPELFIGDVLWFVDTVKLVEGNTAKQTKLRSEFFGDEITMSISTNVVVTYAVESVRIPEDPVTIEKGFDTQLTIEHSPAKATINSVTWASLDNNIAIVDQNGFVTAVEAGSTTIRAVVNDLYIATANINVLDNELVISCDVATNPSEFMVLDGDGFGVSINDEELSTSAKDTAVYDLLRNRPESAVINSHTFTTPITPTVDQTGHMELTGTFDVWVGGMLIAKDATADDVEKLLREHPQLSQPSSNK